MANEQNCFEEILILDSSTAIKSKLKQVLFSNSFCGLCLSVAAEFTSVFTELEIFGDFGIHTVTIKDIINFVFKNEVSENLGQPHICSKCLRQLCDSYLFLCNTNYTMKVMTEYVYTLDSRVSEVNNTENLEKLIISLHHRESEKIILESDQKQICVDSGFKCLKCNRIIQPYELFKTHERNHKWKTKKKCEFCHELVYVKGYNKHLRSKHRNDVYSCNICNKGYRRKFLYTRHMKVHSPATDNKVDIIVPFHMETDDCGLRCQLCFKLLDQIDFKTHKCKYSCPDCDIYKCVHFDYLLSCLTQMVMKTKMSCPEQYCDYTCVRRADFVAHLNKEHLNYHPFTCDICKQQFYSKHVMKNHIVNYHQENYICQYCDKDFCDTKHLFPDHEEKCKAVARKFKCVKCVASFESSKDLEKHSSQGCKYIPCPFCNLKFDSEGKLTEHKTKVHKGIQMVYSYKSMECPVCNQKFESTKYLDIHTQTHGQKVEWTCDMCNKTFCTKRKLTVHISSIHVQVPCEICNKMCTRSTIKTHMAIHGKERNITKYSCHICGEVRKGKREFEIHFSKHTERVKCPECSKLIHEGRLKYHLLYHQRRKERIAKNKFYTKKCHLCDFKAISNTVIETHINQIHLKIKPYSCNICGNSYCGKLHLASHMQTHTRIKEVTCEICNTLFANKGTYRRHMIKKHSNIRPFKCDVCSESFALINDMKVHKVNKHSAKDVACPVTDCASKFASRRHMRLHVTRVHWKRKNKPLDPKQIEGIPERFYHLFDDRRKCNIALDNNDQVVN